jgi:hypothetical protein
MRARHLMGHLDSSEKDKKVASALEEAALWLSVLACVIAVLLAIRLPL